MTAEEFESLYLPDKTVELVRGRLVVSEPPGTMHGLIQARVSYRLIGYVIEHNLGEVLVEPGFKVQRDPDTVRGPDIAFISQERVDQVPRRGFADFPPDLIVEVLSPGNRPTEMLGRIGDFLEAGTRLVWVIDPELREARVYRADGTVGIVGADGSLDGEDILPGFRCALSEVLA